VRDFPLRAWLFTAAIATIAATVILRLAPEQGVNVAAAVGFGLLFFVCELAPISFPNASYSVSFVMAVAALTAVGPAEAAIAASFGAVDLSVRKRNDWLGRMVFNGAQLTLSTALAGYVYVGMDGPVGAIGARDFPGIFGPLFAMAIVYFVVNTGLVSLMVSIVRRVAMFDVWSANFLSVVASTIAFAVFGVLLSSLYAGMGFLAVLFILLPMVIARRALQAAVKVESTYEDVVSGLVSAIEAKDAYTRGHAERVSRLSAMIARELGFSERRARALRIAALMHDVGKLVVSTTILTKPGKLTEEEYEHMKWHPVHGCEIVDEIDFLRDGEAVEAVRHHHERLDGRGYPDGLAGDGIPLTARIVMVADAFDSMTSTRSYRQCRPVEDGLKELRRCEGTQFDSRCINALVRAIDKHGWEPTPEYYEGEKTERPAVGVHAAHA